MKSLEEKKLLVKMARMLGQPVDQELVESIEREEKLTKLLFKEEKKEIIGYEEGTTFLNRKPIIQEVVEPKPVFVQEVVQPEPVFEPPFPTKKDMVDQVVDVLKTASPPAPATNVYRDKELDTIRKTLAEMMQKIATMSWGGGGTGIVRIWDADDLVRETAQNGRYVQYQNGKFVLDEINPYEIIHNTTEVTSTTYVVQDSDYYIGVNVAATSTIILPSDPSSGRMIVIKDESGNCQNNHIIISGTIDNDAGGVILAINNGAVQLLFRNGWRII